jgi:hypothetical protein
MAHTVPMIGIDTAELAWIRMLVRLLRHPDPVVPELTRQALNHLEEPQVLNQIERALPEESPRLGGAFGAPTRHLVSKRLKRFDYGVLHRLSFDQAVCQALSVPVSAGKLS